MISSEKPASPRSIEMQRAIIPEIMQAVTQNTEDYLESAMKKKIAQNATARVALQQKTVPRSSSKENHSQNSQAMLQPRPGMSQYDSRTSSDPAQQNLRPQYNYSPSSNQQNRIPYNVDSRLQQPPERFKMPSPSLSHAQINNPNEEWISPPHSPGGHTTNNDIKQVLYSNGKCDVFHWNNQKWYAVDGQCLLQVRLTNSNRTCVTVELQNKGQLYLNAWIVPNTTIRQTSSTDVSLSVYMGTKKENYLIHFSHPQEASALVYILHNAHQKSAQQTGVKIEDEPVDNVNCPQTLSLVMQCRAKLFVQTETSKWNTFGGVTVQVSQQAPSMRTVIQIENDKTKLVNAIVRSGNVEKISSKRISFLLSDEVQKTSIVYMIHLHEEETGNKIYEQIRLKNAEYGW